MMEHEINYYPLIECDSDGTTYNAMIPNTEEKVVKAHHELWIMEIIPNCFRLCCTDAGSKKLENKITISCPRCGNNLHMLAKAINKNKRGLYVCNTCRK